MFASQVRKTIELDGEPYEIRKLSWKSLEKAKEAHQIASAAPMRAYGGEIMKALRSDALEEAAKSLEAKRATAEGRQEERYAAYDRSSVLLAGLTSWPSERKIEPISIDDLVEEKANALHRAILDLSLPPIEADDTIPNDASGASIRS